MRIRTALDTDEGVARILDLPCGHGRVLRFLRREWPGAEIVACDIDPDGAEFCCESFGATSIYAAENPQETPLRGRFDVIWSGSLLTHLDKTRWPSFL